MTDQEVRFRALPYWPHPAAVDDLRRQSPFSASWGETLDLLRYELRRLHAEDVILGCGMRPEDLRLDGWPRANAQPPSHPGIELSYKAPSSNLRGERLVRQHGSVKRAMAATHPDVGGDMEDFVAVGALASEKRHVYATDVCARWQDNVRSIALGLQALRAVGRFGITPSGQQYAGFRGSLTSGSPG